MHCMQVSLASVAGFTEVMQDDGTMTCACLQVLICPALDLAEFNTPSYAEFKDDKWESKADLEWFWKQYLQVTN